MLERYILNSEVFPFLTGKDGILVLAPMQAPVTTPEKLEIIAPMP